MSWRDYPHYPRVFPPLIVGLAKLQSRIAQTTDKAKAKKLKREAGRSISQSASGLSLSGCSSKVNGNE